MKRPRMFAVLALLTSLAATTFAADEVAEGARVRVLATRTGRRPLVGSLVAIDGEALTLRTGKGEARRILRADVRRLDVSRRPGRRRRGALVGLAAGVLGGFIMGAVGNDDGCQPSEYNPCWFGTEPLYSNTELAAMAAVFFGGIGAMAGATAAPGEKWERISDPRVRLTVAPSRGGGAVALSLRF